MSLSIENPDHTALFLDFDGTLVDFAPTPESVVVPHGLPSLLTNINQKLHGALAIITGRDLDSIDALIDLTGIAVAGSHGAQWRTAQGQVSMIEKPTGTLDHARRKLQSFAQEHSLIFEDKGYSLALHYRQKPALESTIDRWLNENLDLAGELSLMQGKRVREIKVAGVNKGKAVERFMSLPPFAGRNPFYLGDDVTDEDAFAWINGANGTSIKVGKGDSLASCRLADCNSVYAWLEQQAQAWGIESE